MFDKKVFSKDFRHNFKLFSFRMRRFTTNVPEKEAMDEHTGCPRKHDSS